MMNKWISVLLMAVLSLLSGCQSRQPLTFAWLSDTHVSATTTGEADLKAAVADINTLGHVDFVLVSGDITDLNIGGNLDRAKSVLDRLKVPYHIIPGNHDTKWTDSGNGNFIDLWGDDKFIFEQQGICFIGLHQGPELRMADGHLAPHDLSWLKERLANLKDPEQPVILVTHYPIDESIDNYQALLAVIKDYNIRMVLHGHGHANRMTAYSGIPGVMGRSSLRARAEKGGYTLATLTADSVFFRERSTGGPTGHVWGRLSLLEPSYTVAADSASWEETYDRGVDKAWAFNSGNLMAASPAVSGKRLFVGDARGIMHALSLEDGRVLWRYEAGQKIFGTAAVSEKHLVFGVADGRILCLDTGSGALQWAFQTRMPNVAVPVIDESVVYIGGSDSTFRALSLDSGELIWSYDGVAGYVESRPLLAGDKVIFTAWDKTVYALNRSSGAEAWTWAEGRDHLLYSPAACWPVAAHGKVFITAPDRFLTAIDLESGRTVYRSNRYKVRETLGISEDGSRVYGECMRDTVFALDTQRNRYQPVWVRHFGYGYDIAPSQLQSLGGKMYFGTKNGRIYAFDEASGEIAWEVKYGNTVINTVVPVAGGIVFSTMDGHVVRLVEQQ